MLYGDVHPSTVIHLVNCTCENLQQEETRVLLKTGDQHTLSRTYVGRIAGVVPSWENCEAGRRDTLCRYSSYIVLTSNQLTVAAKFDGRKQRDHYSIRTGAGFQVPYEMEKHAKLDGVVLEMFIIVLLFT